VRRDPARAKARQFRRTAFVAVTGTALLLAGCSRGGGGWWTRPTTTTVPGGGGQPAAADWTMSGKDINNSRNASTETKISAATAANLKQKWAIDMKGDVSASPAVVGDVLYVPDFGGYLSAINAKTGAVIWQKAVQEYTGNPQSMMRNTPVVDGNNLIIGEIKHHSHSAPEGGDDHSGGGTDDHSGGGTDDHSGGGMDDHAMPVSAAAEHGDHDDHGTPAPTTKTTQPTATTKTTRPTPTTATTAAPTTTEATGGDHHGGSEAGMDDHDAQPPGTEGAHILAINRQTGALVWKTEVDKHPKAMITSNPVLVNGKITVGVSSSEEDAAQSSDYKCCSFRGSVVKVDAKTGHLDWQTYTVPANPTGKTCDVYDPMVDNYQNCADSGVAVWNTPAVDPTRGSVFVGTGNNYTVTDAEAKCFWEAKAASKSPDGCTSDENHIESIMSLDWNTGAIKWTKKLSAWDAWNYQCLFNPGATWCPAPDSEDSDFGSNTNLFSATINGQKTDLVGVGQKNGIYWALNRDTGEVVWNTLVGPGSFLGGIEWGSAFDGQRLYVANANITNTEYTLPSGEKAKGGSWTALDPATGKILWQTASPAAAPNGALGATTVANGVVFGGTTSATGENMYALDAASGQILWKFAATGSVNSGPSVANGTVYWGSGYAHMDTLGMVGGQKLYAFSVDGQ
jgi:polyvinyl alcohol dehydrogenase (cytochrome)